MPKIVDHEQRRNDIAAAVTRVASSRGLSAATLGNVAEEAGISKSLLRHYFPTREEMILHSLGWLRGSIEARAHDRLAETAPESDLDSLREVLIAMIPRTEDERTQAILGSEAFVLEIQEPAIRDTFAAGHQMLVDNIAAIISAAREHGETTLAESAAPARLAVALVDGLVGQIVLGYCTTEEAEDTIRLWIDGLRR